MVGAKGSHEYSREVTKICVVKICQTIGWNTSMTTPLEMLTDILCDYIYQLGKSTTEYANSFGMNEPNLDHLALTFRDFHINLSELEEYAKYVDFVEPLRNVPKFPIPKENHLNFLKPGSQEVVTRPVHIHEHLPPMYPVLEAVENEPKIKKEEPDDPGDGDLCTPGFKKLPESPAGETFKRPRLIMEDEGRPTREISSVMMTTSGFISPAREGKLPESRTPVAALEPLAPPLPLPQAQPTEIKKPVKVVKRIEKKKIDKELFKHTTTEEKIKKAVASKEVLKSKLKPAQSFNAALAAANTFVLNNDVKISPILHNKLPQPHVKFNKTLAAARLKTEKLNTTITPIPTKTLLTQMLPQNDLLVDKLFSEPDKKKVNIFKKISNVKNDKIETKITKIKEEIKHESREHSPNLIIDESTAEISNKVHRLSSDITIELIEAPGTTKSPKVERSYFDYESPPGTPRTPEMLSHSPPIMKEKRKRKDKSKIKRLQKQPSPTRMDTDVMEIEMERPKTPEAQVIIKHEPPSITPTLPFPFFSNFGGPGLIPTPLSNPLFPHLPLPPLNLPSFGQPPYLHTVRPGLPMNFLQPPKIEESTARPTVIEKVTATATTSIEKPALSPKIEKKPKDHKKEKKDKLKKKNKKEKVKNKAEKKKLKEEKKDKVKKEKKEKRKEKEARDGEISVPKLTLKLGSGSPRPEAPDTRKLTIKPIVRRDDEVSTTSDVKREMSPELAKISALVTGQPKPKAIVPQATITKEDAVKEEVASIPVATPIKAGPGPGRPRIHPLKVKPSKPNKPQKMDPEGNKVWICPACGRQDDGSPMIGCDDCDAWYHWVCVGIQVPPDDNENWYCRLCISKKQEVLQTDKKKKRKKREKKEN